MNFRRTLGLTLCALLVATTAGALPEVVGDAGRTVSLEHYGASAAFQTLYDEFDITAEAVVSAAKESIAASGHTGGVGVFAKPMQTILPQTKH